MDPECFGREDPTTPTIFLVRGEDLNSTKGGPPSARKQSAVDDDDPTLNAGLVVL